LPNRTGNRVFAVLLLILAVGMFAATLGFPPPGQADDPGTATFPRMLAGALLALAVLQFLRPGEMEDLPRGGAAIRVSAIVALLLVYAVVLEPLGFMLATMLFLAVALVLAGARSLLSLTLIPVGVSFALFYVFNQLLSVSLPRAFLEGLLF
jgi:putative tricarboxylic transport membrane protein